MKKKWLILGIGGLKSLIIPNLDFLTISEPYGRFFRFLSDFRLFFRSE